MTYDRTQLGNTRRIDEYELQPTAMATLRGVYAYAERTPRRPN